MSVANQAGASEMTSSTCCNVARTVAASLGWRGRLSCRHWRARWNRYAVSAASSCRAAVNASSTPSEAPDRLARPFKSRFVRLHKQPRDLHDPRVCVLGRSVELLESLSHGDQQRSLPTVPFTAHSCDWSCDARSGTGGRAGRGRLGECPDARQEESDRFVGDGLQAGGRPLFSYPPEDHAGVHVAEGSRSGGNVDACIDLAA